MRASTDRGLLFRCRQNTLQKRQLKMPRIWMCCYLFLFLFVLVDTFNIDTKHPVIYHGNTDSYFGYSVALLNNTRGTWVIVGAPRDNDPLQPHVRRPGVVYLCPFPQTSNCSQIAIDATGNTQQTVRFHGRNLTFHNEKNDQWLGVSLDVHPKYMDSFLVCAHRWSDSYTHRKMGDILHMNGICYQVNSNMADTGRPVPALTRLDRLVNRRWRYAEFSMGTLGVSAIISNDGSRLLMGAPGLNDWSGGLAMERNSNYSSDVQYIEPPRTLYHDSYIGYSVATGKFVSRSSYGVALGAPTGQGKVLFYGLAYPKRLPEFTIEGEQFGSYFGSVLCTINLDSDNWDDILIGAPLYSTESSVEQGLVYVFRTRGAMGFSKLQTLDGSASDRARFGSAIVNLGDINGDGFQDIAVGAPFEDDSRGVVYVYNGYKAGMWTHYTQKISSKNIRQELRGFGASFSRSYDMDNIGFNDIAVGAYLSSQVVFLRTRPLVDIIATMDMIPRAIDTKTSCRLTGLIVPCIKLKLCFLYASIQQGIPDHMELKYNLQFDSKRRVSRAVTFQSSDHFALQEMTSVSGKVTLKKYMMNCSIQYTVYIRSLEDRRDGIEFKLSYKEKFAKKGREIRPMTNYFDGKREVFHRRNRVTAVIPYAKECGADDICHSDMQIHKQTIMCNGHKDYCIIGDSNDVRIVTYIQNKGEIAYGSLLYFRVSSDLKIHRSFMKWNDSKTDITCSIKLLNKRNKFSTATCTFGDVTAGKGEIILEFELKSIGNRSIVDIETELFTSSREVNISNNRIVKKLRVLVLPEIKMLGYSQPDQHALRRTTSIDGAENITHSFQVDNDGPSTLNQSYFFISVPIVPRQIYMTNYEIDAAAVSRRKVSCSGNPVVQQNNYDIEPSILQPVFTVSCRKHSCVTLQCQLKNFTKHDTVTIKAFLGVSKTFIRNYQTVRRITLISNATVVIPDSPRLLLTSKQIHAWAVTDIFPPRQRVNDDEFHLWIALISLCSGILLVFFMGLVLRKCGFFRRTHREMLLQLQASRWALLTNIQSGREENEIAGDDSNENLVSTEYITVLNSPPHSDYSPDSPTSRTFDDEYLEPIQTLYRK